MSASDIQEIFMHEARAAAKAIREGSLFVEPVTVWSQVHRSSWEPLAIINELGLVTYNSQDAVRADNGQIKSYERSYVEGLMLPDNVEQFVEKINMFSDKVAYREMDMDPQVSMAEWLKAPSISMAKYRGETRGSWYTGMALKTEIKQSSIRDLKKDVGVSDKIPVVCVAIFDPKWGRTATSKNGLFNVIIKALTPGEYKWAPNKRLEEKYQKYKAQGR